MNFLFILYIISIPCHIHACSHMSCYSTQTLTGSSMAWSLYLSNTNAASVTDEQLAQLDEYEVACRAGSEPRAQLLSTNIGQIVDALICAAGAINSRSQMLRSVNLLQDVLRDVDDQLLRVAIRGVSACHISRLERKALPMPMSKNERTCTSLSSHQFINPLVNIAVNRISDIQLSAVAADSLSILLGCPSLDRGADEQIPAFICDEAEGQTRRLIAMLITEIVLTGSPRALSSLAKLLRRDMARQIFCEKDGVSTLASTLQTDPEKCYTAIGEIIAKAKMDADPVYASYHAVFALWMLTFASKPAVVRLFLQRVCSSRLVVVLARLLRHASGQRLKIARVTLASLRNMAEGSLELHKRVRRDLISANVPAVLQRLVQMTSGAAALIGKDDDAMQDAHVVLDLLRTEEESMSTIDAYIAEVRAGALHWSAIHTDSVFWNARAQKMLDCHPGVLPLLADTIHSDKTSTEERVVACNDLVMIMRGSDTGRLAVLKQAGLKHRLMVLMTSDWCDSGLRMAALSCVQVMLVCGR